jgi:uncharacterized membrane protein YgcG
VACLARGALLAMGTHMNRTKTLETGSLVILAAVAQLASGCSGAKEKLASSSAASSGESAPCTSITQLGQSIVDASGNTWTLEGPSTNLVVYENGALAGYSANVTELLYVGQVVSQENAAGGWWSWGNGTWNAESSPAGACTESPSCTTVTAPGASIVDGSGNVWSLEGPASNLVIYENGALAGYSANVTELLYVNHVVSQENTAGGWWDWANGGWKGESDPSGACSGSGSSSGGSSSGSGSSSGGGGSGGFSVSSGQIIGPDGSPFVARGVDCDDSIPASQVTPLFPGLNFVRLPTSNWPSASDLQAEVTSFTSAGIVVEIEDHPWPEVAPYTGSDLASETSWYASLASAFNGNPYVWFGTMNEPQTAYGSAEAAISVQEAAIYGAIRGTGNNTIIMMELMGGGNPGTIGAGFGMTPSTYSSMTGIVWDFHFYGWDSGYSTDQATVNAALLGSASSGDGILAAQTITSADGVVPVLIGEYGNSTDGQNVDPNWTQVLTAVETSGYGSAAWEVGVGGVADVLVSGGSLTAYGQIVAQYIAE